MIYFVTNYFATKPEMFQLDMATEEKWQKAETWASLSVFATTSYLHSSFRAKIVYTYLLIHMSVTAHGRGYVTPELN